jgi:putative DNA primase/helicase
MPTTLLENVTYCYETLGWSFTPLRGGADSKKARLPEWQSRPRETLDEALQWAAQGNVGLRTGKNSGIVVIDVEFGGEYGFLNLPGTVRVATGGGGLHLYFRCSVPFANTTKKLGTPDDLVDTKGDGGYVVFPGSMHPETGQMYDWEPGFEPWNVEIATIPDHVLALMDGLKKQSKAPMTPTTRPAVQGNTKVERWARTALCRELDAVARATEGTRNDTLNRAAFSLGTLIGAGCLNRQEVEAALRQTALNMGLEPHETDATIRSGIESGMQHPRQLPEPRGKGGGSPTPTAAGKVPDLPAHQFKLDLYGNADRFMHLFGPNVHWCEDRGQWLVWNGRVWDRDATREASRLAELMIRALLKEAAKADDETIKWAVKCNKGARPRTEMLEVVKHRTAVRIDQFDRDPWLLGVENGVVDLKTGKLLPHDRERMISILCPTAYDPHAPCPRWEQFLSEIMAGDDEMIACLQRMAGHFLTGDISMHILPIFYGPGSNGKNVFLDTLMGIMGPLATEAPESLITARRSDEHPTEIAGLHGKRLVVASETEEGRKMRIGLVKKITGNKYLMGRFMRQDFFQFERTHKTVLVTNNKPVVTEVSNAIWRRLRLIPFTVTIPEDKQDRRLTEKLVAEWPGILAWMVRGCLDWQQRQCDLALPERVADATAEYRTESDSVGSFVDERCIVAEGLKVARSTLYQAYEEWAQNTGEQTLNGKAFATRMRGRGLDDSGWTTECGKRLRAWSGIALAGPTEERP